MTTNQDYFTLLRAKVKAEEMREEINKLKAVSTTRVVELSLLSNQLAAKIRETIGEAIREEGV